MRRVEAGSVSEADPLSKFFGAGPRQKVHGAVIDVTTGDPVPYVDVLFRRVKLEETANSGASGEYEIELPPGTFEVRAVGDGVLGTTQPPLLLGQVRSPVRYDVEVQRVATVAGRVVAPSGHPVADARVEYGAVTSAQKLHVRNRDFDTSVTTAGDGSFALDVIGTGHVHIDAHAGELRGHAFLTDIWPGSERTGVVIELDAGALVSGVVVDPDRTPVAGATVQAWVHEADKHMVERSEVVTDEDGRYRFERMISGAVTLDARAVGYGASAPMTRKLAEGADVSIESSSWNGPRCPAASSTRRATGGGPQRSKPSRSARDSRA